MFAKVIIDGRCEVIWGEFFPLLGELFEYLSFEEHGGNPSEWETSEDNNINLREELEAIKVLFDVTLNEKVPGGMTIQEKFDRLDDRVSSELIEEIRQQNNMYAEDIQNRYMRDYSFAHDVNALIDSVKDPDMREYFSSKKDRILRTNEHKLLSAISTLSSTIELLKKI